MHGGQDNVNTRLFMQVIIGTRDVKSDIVHYHYGMVQLENQDCL